MSRRVQPFQPGPSRCSWRQGPRISPGPVTRSVGRKAWPFARCAWAKIWRDLLGRLGGEMNLCMGNLWKFHGDLWTSYGILWDKNRWFTHQMREWNKERCGGKKHHTCGVKHRLKASNIGILNDHQKLGFFIPQIQALALSRINS